MHCGFMVAFSSPEDFIVTILLCGFVVGITVVLYILLYSLSSPSAGSPAVHYGALCGGPGLTQDLHSIGTVRLLPLSTRHLRRLHPLLQSPG